MVMFDFIDHILLPNTLLTIDIGALQINLLTYLLYMYVNNQTRPILAYNYPLIRHPGMPYGFVRICICIFVFHRQGFRTITLNAKADRSEIFAGHGGWSKEEVYRFATQTWRAPTPQKSRFAFQDTRNIFRKKIVVN